MNIQLQIDDNLLREALELGKHQSQQTLVEEALREYIQRRKQIKILDLFGTIEYDENYDYKQQRQIP
jgi:Arc/MetJ family transcription regulator